MRSFDPVGDSQPMFNVYGDPEVMRFIPGGALPDVEAVEELLDEYVRAQAVEGFSSWGIVERAPGRLIGDVGFGIFEPTGEIEIELGFTLARAYWGRGYATESARACLLAGLAQLRTERIIVVVDERNDPSLRVADRIGMQRIGSVVAHDGPHVLLATV